MNVVTSVQRISTDVTRATNKVLVTSVAIAGVTATGAAGLRYEHDQQSAAAQWVVNHGLGKYPHSIHVIDTTGDDVIADVKHIDVNTLNINFSSAMAGKAFIGA